MDDLEFDKRGIAIGDAAFLSLTQQIDHLLGLIDFFFARYQNSGSYALSQKCNDLEVSLKTLGPLPIQIAEVIKTWKHGKPRVLSSEGVEVNLLNELWITICAVHSILCSEGVDPHPFNYWKAEEAFNDLVLVNRMVL
jgi:hypothetical protein